MRIAVAIVFVVALCSHVCVVTCAPSSSPALTSSLAGAITTTTAKPWTQKVKDGLGKFFQGAAIAGAVSQGFQNARSHKHKPSVPAAKPTH